MARVLITFLIPIVCGAGGFFLRRYQLLTGFDDAGLALPGNSAALMLIVLCATVVIACIILSAVCRKQAQLTYIDTFAVPGNVFYLIFSLLPALLLIISAAFGLLETFNALGAENGINWLELIQWILCLLTVFCLLSLAVSNFRYNGRHSSNGEPQRQNSFALLALPFTACLWLVTTYQEYSSDPVIFDYIYQLLAVICILLAVYFVCAFSFGKPHPRLCLLFNLLGIYFSLVSLADSLSWPVRLLLMGCILYLAYNSLLLLLRSTMIKKPTSGEDDDWFQEKDSSEPLSVDSILDDMIPESEQDDTGKTN